MHKSFVVSRTWVLTLDLFPSVSLSGSRKLASNRFISIAPMDKRTTRNNEKLDNCLCNAARYLIILHVVALFISMTVAMRSIRKQNIAMDYFIVDLRNRRCDDRLEFLLSLSSPHFLMRFNILNYMQ